MCLFASHLEQLLTLYCFAVSRPSFSLMNAIALKTFSLNVLCVFFSSVLYICKRVSFPYVFPSQSSYNPATAFIHILKLICSHLGTVGLEFEIICMLISLLFLLLLFENSFQCWNSYEFRVLDFWSYFSQFPKQRVQSYFLLYVRESLCWSANSMSELLC